MTSQNNLSSFGSSRQYNTFSSRTGSLQIDRTIHELKVILLGDVAVGKTAMFNRFVDNTFIDEYVSNIGVAFILKLLADVIDVKAIHTTERQFMCGVNFLLRFVHIKRKRCPICRSMRNKTGNIKRIRHDAAKSPIDNHYFACMVHSVKLQEVPIRKRPWAGNLPVQKNTVCFSCLYSLRPIFWAIPCILQLNLFLIYSLFLPIGALL